MKFYIVIYSDYDCYYDIRGVFTNELKANRCKEYELERIGNGGYGEKVEIVVAKCSDYEDFDVKIAKLQEERRVKQQKVDDEIKATEIALYNQIKEKYNL